MRVVKVLDVSDIQIIVDKLEHRRLIGEDMMMAVGVVLMNYGDGYVRTICTGGEWQGAKSELAPSSGVPLCPSGHPLFELTNAPRLALVEED